jgi:ATP-dependent DNA ligase
MLLKVPELADIYKQIKKSCILDGELIVIKDGKPDFFEIQRRSLTSNKFKIERMSKQSPATFTAFDILYYDGEQLTGKTLTERKRILETAFTENERLALSRYIEGQGVAFFELAKQHELEGIVAKRKDSIYKLDTRTKDWIKVKHLIDDDFVVCGYIEKENNMISIVLGQYDNGKMIYMGHAT